MGTQLGAPKLNWEATGSQTGSPRAELGTPEPNWEAMGDPKTPTGWHWAAPDPAFSIGRAAGADPSYDPQVSEGCWGQLWDTGGVVMGLCGAVRGGYRAVIRIYGAVTGHYGALWGGYGVVIRICGAVTGRYGALWGGYGAVLRIYGALWGTVGHWGSS